MRVLLSPLAAMVFSAIAAFAQPREPVPPNYSAETILNAASAQPDQFAPYAQIAIHGSNLGFQSVAVDLSDVSAIPVTLGSATTRGWIRNFPLGMISVSPEEVVALIPPDLLPGNGFLRMSVNGKLGPQIPVTIRRAAPGVFLREEGIAAVDSEEPATPGSLVTIFATGLGPVRPAPDGFIILRRLAPSTVPVRVSLDSVELDSVDFAGLQTGMPGVYQVRIRLPDSLTASPEVRILVEGASSQDGVRIPVRIPDTAPPVAVRIR